MDDPIGQLNTINFTSRHFFSGLEEQLFAEFEILQGGGGGGCRLNQEISLFCEIFCFTPL